MIRTTNLHKSYGSFEALRGIDLEIKEEAESPVFEAGRKARRQRKGASKDPAAEANPVKEEEPVPVKEQHGRETTIDECMACLYGSTQEDYGWVHVCIRSTQPRGD